MKMSSFPVVIRCGNISVAISISKLLKESTVFKAMYENQHEQRSCSQDLVPSNSNPSVEKSVKIKPRDKTEQKEEDGTNDQNGAVLNNSNGESEDSGINSNEDEVVLQASNTNPVESPKGSGATPEITEHEKSLDDAKDEKKECEQADIFEITGYMEESVQALFGYLAGFTEILTGCTSIQILADVLKICGAFHIHCSLPLISQRIDACSTIDIDNLVDTTEAAIKIQRIMSIEKCESISDYLLGRCILYASKNFGSWLKISHFLLKNEDKSDITNKLLCHLKNDQKFGGGRYKFPLSDKPIELQKLIHKNLEWKFTIRQTEEAGTKYLTCDLDCINPVGGENWFCESHVEVKLLNQKDDNHAMGFFDKKFDARNKRHGFPRFKAWSDVIDPDQGFIKDGEVIFFVNMTVKDVAGIKDSRGIQEKDIILWDEFQFDSTVSYESNIATVEAASLSQERSIDEQVMLTCESMCMVIPQSVLMKDSMYFKALFNGDWSSEGIPESLGTENLEKISVARTRQIKIQGYKEKAVRILFDYLQGFEAEMEKCISFTLLADMMSISDFYIIGRSLPIIISRINTIVISMDNLIEAYGTAQKIKVMEPHKGLGEYLASRCIAYARANLSSWQVLIKFVVENYSNMNLVNDLNQILTRDKTAVFRYKVDNYSTLTGEVNTPSYAFHNMEFVLNMKKTKDFLSVFLVWSLPDNSVTKAKVKFELKLYNYLDRSYYTKSGELEVLKNKGGRAGFSEFMACTESDPGADNGYVKDDAIFVEAKLEIVEFE